MFGASEVREILGLVLDRYAGVPRSKTISRAMMAEQTTMTRKYRMKR